MVVVAVAAAAAGTRLIAFQSSLCNTSCSTEHSPHLIEMEYVSPEGLRLDGRRPMEMRQLRAEIGGVAKADGSAMFEMGNTKVIAAVYGPREVQNRSQQITDQALVRCEYSMANFSTGDRMRKPRVTVYKLLTCIELGGKLSGKLTVHAPGYGRSTEISLVIRQTMEACILTNLMPHSQIDIFVQVLQADGGTRSACINAATLALADAGIPMCDIVTSCSAGYLNSTPLLDLNYVEDSAGGPDVTVGILPTLDKVTLLQLQISDVWSWVHVLSSINIASFGLYELFGFIYTVCGCKEVNVDPGSHGNQIKERRVFKLFGKKFTPGALISDIFLPQMDAKLPTDTFEDVMQLATEGCKAVANYIREVLLENTKQLGVSPRFIIANYSG
ncbi:hypothetical protein Patl1_06580 [Pistacia atlantica]|uniref:Uncharacterized protein n=1 Tax=Pistacia atlantica TaxID=434234 RepID=A0ACC1BP69_9ROSI|nr:hypothetical protein Patl1_06580 [Pistacia atlantica]